MAGTAEAIAATGGDGASMRIGTVVDYDGGSISVDVGGGVLQNARYLSNYNPTVGDEVVIINRGSTWAVLGNFGATPGQLVPQADTVADLGSTTSTAFVDLATFGPQVTVNIGASGKALVVVSADIFCTQEQAQMGWAVSGATTRAAEIATALIGSAIASGGVGINASVAVGASRLVTASGLTPGENVFTAKYSVNNGNNGFFQDRHIIVIPL